jgi:hypothetical protein
MARMLHFTKLLILLVGLLVVVAMATMSTVRVEAQAVAERTLPATVAGGDEFSVAIEISGYGLFSRVTETLPAGFAYVGSSLDPLQVEISGQEVNFTLIGEDVSFTYNVLAVATTGVYTFAGTLMDQDRNGHPMGGAQQISVEGVAPTPGATPTPGNGLHPGAWAGIGIGAALFFGLVLALVLRSRRN